MRVLRSCRTLKTAYNLQFSSKSVYPSIVSRTQYRHFQSAAALRKIYQHTLSDIGEGVKEVQIIQWFVEEGASVEEWAPLCEVQSDKASVDITSRYTGVVKKLHFERDAIVQVGDAMLDIEVESTEGTEEETPSKEQDPTEGEPAASRSQDSDAQEGVAAEDGPRGGEEDAGSSHERPSPTPDIPPSHDKGKHANLATPAVRGLLKEHKLDIADIKGTGKDGRVLKEDVHKHLEAARNSPMPSIPSKPELDSKQVETVQNLTPIQSAMFKSMTKSLSIPHFLFSDSINVTALAAMRSRLNASRRPETDPKYSYLPFVIKAVSLALNHYPILNARLDTTSNPSKPNLVLRAHHNISVAMDTPNGLVVPVIKSVNARSITSIAQELQRLSELGQAGKLSNADMTGGTITVSNIGNIGGEVLAPVLVEGQLAIMGLGRIKPTPVFAADGHTVERADLMSANWSADHRVVDGATMAKAARLVQKYLETPESMLVDMS